MKENRIKRFNENSELNISDVSNCMSNLKDDNDRLDMEIVSKYEE